MSPKAVDFLLPVGERLAGWMRPHSAKELARMFDVEPRTAKGWRVGCLPQVRHLVRMTQRWGSAFLNDVFSPVLAEPDISTRFRIERIEHELAHLKETLNDDVRKNNGASTLHASGVALDPGTPVAGARQPLDQTALSIPVLSGPPLGQDKKQKARLWARKAGESRRAHSP